VNDNTKQGFGRVSQKSNKISSKPSHKTPRRDSLHFTTSHLTTPHYTSLHHDSPCLTTPHLAAILLTPIRCSCRNGSHINPINEKGSKKRF